MPADWSRDSAELVIALDRTGISFALQIQGHLRDAIREGRLVAGERLPSTRRLADQLGVSRGTVVEVYEQLGAEGYVDSVVGSGTRVARIPGIQRPRTGVPAAAAPRPNIQIDFEYGIPDLGSVPLRDWVWAVGEATRTLPTAGLGDEEPAGSRHLREVVTAYHRRVRAGCATADDAVVVGGFRQGLAFTLAVLARSGIEVLALEDPGPREHDIIAERAGLNVVAVPVDAEGLNVAALRASRARAVLVTPAHQCPTGVALSPTRRRELVAWAHEVDGVILEDDYDAEFRYDRQAVGSLQGLDPERVFALGSVSKTIAPAIRIGWVLAPPRFVEALSEEKQLSSRGAPGLDQEALALLIESGRFDRHLRRVRELYRKRRDTLAKEVAAVFGPDRLHGLAAGCHAVLQLPLDVDEDAVVESAQSLGVRVTGLRPYRLTYPPAPPALLLAFGNLSEHQLVRGVHAIAEAVRRSKSPKSRQIASLSLSTMPGGRTPVRHRSPGSPRSSTAT
ncbi:MocR-like pyridoxine biosynthesis transcription factor PdxR [Kribbella monticola]|uniref:MocR-like pyridoxine biosynthesis transcription factor PdxR n=1 Tax=Kribbella monticola TaxID=2185285 RepID=UPI000DD3F952|nr:PLP-dependent aminotransferase family protein [Kribbella monticola]